MIVCLVGIVYFCSIINSRNSSPSICRLTHTAYLLRSNYFLEMKPSNIYFSFLFFSLFIWSEVSNVSMQIFYWCNQALFYEVLIGNLFNCFVRYVNKIINKILVCDSFTLCCRISNEFDGKILLSHKHYHIYCIYSHDMINFIFASNWNTCGKC